MTVSTSTNSGSFVADGLATPRSINFRLIDHADLIVTANGVTQTLNVHYSLSGTFPAITMTPITPYWASGVVVRYRRKTPAKQQYEVNAGVDLQSESLEFELDRQTMALQDVEGDLQNTKSRALMVPVGETAPLVVGLAGGEGKFLGIEGGEIKPLSSPDAVLLAEANAALTAANNALATVVGPLAPVTRYAPRARRWTSPSGMNNPLGIAMDCDGQKYSYSTDPYALNDWTNFETGITHLYIAPRTGLDSNSGTSPSLPWKSLVKAQASAPHKSVLHYIEPESDFNASVATTYDFGTRWIKIVSDVSIGTVFTTWSFAYNLAYMAWVKDGAAYKSTASVNGSAIQAMVDRKYLDPWGLGLDMQYLTSSAAVKATPGSWWFDTGTGTLWVQRIDGTVPDPATGWTPITSFGGYSFLTDGQLVIENCEFAYNGGGANSNALRIRPTTAFVTNDAKVALKKVRAYGADANAIQIMDFDTTVLQQCAGSSCLYDIFNYSSFITTGIQAQDQTVYEDRCHGHKAGSTIGKVLANPSNSNNLSTGHRSKHIYRNGLTGYDIPNSLVADVQGCYSMNAGIILPESTKTGGLFLNNFWNQKLAGEGSAGSKMVLIGCGGEALSAGRNVFSNADDTDANPTLGRIDIADWLGPPSASRKSGTLLYDYERGVAL